MFLSFCAGIYLDASTYAMEVFVQPYLDKEEPRSRSQFRWYHGTILDVPIEQERIDNVFSTVPKLKFEHGNQRLGGVAIAFYI